MIEASGYWVNGLPLWKTRLYWPALYRGCQYVECKIWQPADNFRWLKTLPRSEEGVTLLIKSATADGSRRQQLFKGVQVVDVIEHKPKGIDGCQLILADRRWRLQFYIMGENWSLKYQGNYLAGTAKTKLTPYTLKEAMEIITSQAPFAGYMRKGWSSAFNRVPGAYIPDDLLYSGQNLTKMLEKILDYWGFDLSVDEDGNFYFADRGVSATGDPGIAKIRAAYNALEWVRDYPSLNPARVRGDKPKKFYIYFFEDHNLAVPYLPDPDARSTGIGSPGTAHGLVLRAAYKSLQGYYLWADLLEAWGFDFDTIGLEPRRLLHSPHWYGTQLWLDEKVTQAERERRFAIYMAVQECERAIYAIVHEDLERKAGAWTDMELGVRDASGILFARKAVGDWSELYDEITPPAKAFDVSGGLGRLWVTKADIPLVEIHSSSIVVTGKAVPPVGGSPFEKAGQKQRLSEHRDLADAAPFTVDWKQQSNGIIELGLDKRRVKPGSDALIGTPQEPVPLLSIDRPNGPGNIGKVKDKLYQKYLQNENLRVRQKREDLRWNMNYQFWIFVNARRQIPNSRDKFWREEVSAFGDGTIEYMELEADTRITCQRDWVDYITPDIDGTVEKSRPNGPDRLGKCLNRPQLRAEAFRRARLEIIRMTEPNAWSHEFLAYDKIPSLTLEGSLDSVMIKCDGWLIRGELAVGRRSSDMAQRDEATMRAATQIADMAGKRLRR